MTLERQFKRQYDTHIAAFKSAFPEIVPPACDWFGLWMRKYQFRAISDAINTLAKHPLKSRFSTESCGRAISSLLREDAMRRALATASDAPSEPGESRS
jgi:hypothetical protein